MSEDPITEAVARALAGTEHFDWTPENYDSAKSAAHYGDCTNVAQSCARCYCEEINEVATAAIRALYGALEREGPSEEQVGTVARAIAEANGETWGHIPLDKEDWELFFSEGSRDVNKPMYSDYLAMATAAIRALAAPKPPGAG